MKFLCVHGHFYQPPRENPWTGEIDRQESAAPYHDWNERITAECYAVNADPGLRPTSAGERFPSNYSRMSFDFGPTLLSWLERKAPSVYRAILDADRDSRERFAGHGSAMALAYNHVILPLANRRDKRTQILWGIRDFEHRFHRSPEGLWLPEAAVDSETLEILARCSILFTVLSPHQALRVRGEEDEPWRDVTASNLDTGQPYEARLSTGHRIAIFFYDGAASNAVAFGELAAGPRSLARRLSSFSSPSFSSPSFSSAGSGDALASIATDGETFGHHYRGGERVLAEAFDLIEGEASPRLTNYAQYLADHPARMQVEIRERTAWSCGHGVGRWSEDCGCQTGERPEWNQAWRAPLRAALESLRDRLAELYEQAMQDWFTDPWQVRDDSIEIWLEGNGASASRFLERHARRPLAASERERAIALLDMQRHAMLMFTSCGWYFDDVGGLEGRQILQYAGRAIQIGEQALGASLERPFLEQLERARSNDPDRGDARRLYESLVPRPAAGRSELLGS